MLGLDLTFLNWDIIRNFVVKGFWFSVQLTVIATIGAVPTWAASRLPCR